jgi:signal peptidase I
VSILSQASGTPDSGKRADHRRRPWRDNIEAVVMAIVMAVMLKYFIVEAYQIPTGSMQPTLMGSDEAGIRDRIIVDKLSFHFRDPERFEVVVFKYPLDRSKNFIKRICGMPDEQLKISLGDLWTRKSPAEEYRILRRPIPVQREVWKRIYPKDPRFSSWLVQGGAKSWSVHGRDTIQARGDGTARLPNDGGPIVDSYRDGYPGETGDALGRVRPSSAGHPVGDIRIEGAVRALAGCKSVAVVLREGTRKYVFDLPGPAAGPEAQAGIRTQGFAGQTSGEELSAPSPVPHRLSAGRKISFAAQNMDDLLALEIDGERVAELEIPSASDQTSSFELRVEGEGADFTGVEVYRDIYYTEEGRGTVFQIPPGSYVMLGDNTQDSSDSRFWTFITLGPDAEGNNVRGNSFPPQNPVWVPGDPQGTRVFIRDEWGDLHDFVARPDQDQHLEWAPFVRREMIVGRAVAVFWPISLAYKVWRLQWVH